MQFQKLSDKQWKMVQNIFHHLLDVAEKFGVKVEYGPTISDEGGSYNLVTNVIRLSQENPGTFFHELAHKAHSTLRT